VAKAGGDDLVVRDRRGEKSDVFGETVHLNHGQNELTISSNRHVPAQDSIKAAFKREVTCKRVP